MFAPLDAHQAALAPWLDGGGCTPARSRLKPWKTWADFRVSHLMDVELLYFEDCPNWRVADARVAEVVGGRRVEVRRTLVTTPDEAEALGFRGSPTILVDGRDPFATGDEPVGLACRIYHTPEGPAGSPTVSQLRAVIPPDAG